MEVVTRNSYSLYRRKTGSRTIWYVRFWDDNTQSYTGGRSTGQTTKSAAHRQVQNWLIEGLTGQKQKNPNISQQRILKVIHKFLLESSTVTNDDKYNDSELIKLFYSKVTNNKMSGEETFVDYLNRFWNWSGDYVRSRREQKSLLV
jgi:hypothetical protein